jgi:DHA2 family multidrug resistance protein
MLGPIMGPTLGGWLTDSYSWRWVFFVNLPFGILTVLGLGVFLDETPTRKDVPFSWFGFLTLSLGIGALQMMLDRGQENNWFESNEIIIEAVLSVCGFYFFLSDALTSERPFIPLRIFRDWNFSVALVFMFVIGIILLATMALVTPYIQNLMGYPVLASGYLLGTRGVGTFFAMMLVGRLSGKVDPRLMVGAGLTLATLTLYLMVGWTPDTPARTIAIDSIGQGVGLGLVFVPLNTIAFATLSPAVRTDGAALWTLIRNLGSSVGISLVIAKLTGDITKFHSQLADFINPFNDGFRMPDVVGKMTTAGRGLGMIEGMLTQQAATLAYSNAFLVMTFVSLSAFPLLALIRKTKAPVAARKEDAAHAVMD